MRYSLLAHAPFGIMLLAWLAAFVFVACADLSIKARIAGAFLCAYTVLLTLNALHDLAIDRALQAFDLDGSTFFEPQERTADQQRLLALAVRDTGRSLLPVTGILLALIQAGTAAAAVGFHRRLFRPAR